MSFGRNLSQAAASSVGDGTCVKPRHLFGGTIKYLHRTGSGALLTHFEIPSATLEAADWGGQYLQYALCTPIVAIAFAKSSSLR
jgi:hypothetical protein